MYSPILTGLKANMKVRSYIAAVFAAIILLSSSVLAGQSTNETMYRANELYEKKDYPAAKELYIRLVEQNYQSPELYYNLGNTFYRLGQTGYAVLYYEKALRLAPNDEDIIHNLRFANYHAADRIDVVPELFIVRYYRALLGLFSVNGWTMLSFLLYLLLIISGVMLLFRKPEKAGKPLRVGVWIAAVMLLLLLSILFLRIQYDSNENFAVLVEPAATVKTAPDGQSKDAFIVHEGIKMRMDDSVEGWVKIVLADGKTGWIEKGVIRKI